MTAKVAFVVARAKNGVIGRAGVIPWRVSSDLKRFRKLTMGKPIIMGRKTFESIGRPLDGRDNIVISRKQDFAPEGVHVAASVQEALDLAGELAAQRGVDEIMVIGGGEIYAETLAVADRVYLTEIETSVDGDTHFPDLDPAGWSRVSEERLPRGEKDSAGAVLAVYERTQQDD